ncbi:hypothetical protein GOP80_06860 [Planococcaceae bacterium Storch 2/2-2]|nr:hypothetical protein [Planococcaceae bacterium Storch 2/2-2]
MKVFWNFILTLGLTTSVGFLAWNQQPTEMGIASLVWAFLFLFWNLDKIEYMKIGQVEAKARKLDEIVKEAEVTLNHLKEVASPNVNYTFLLLADEKLHKKENATSLDKIFREVYKLADKLELKNEEDIKRAFYGVINKYRMEIQEEFTLSSGLDYEIEDKINLDGYFDRVEDSLPINDEEDFISVRKKLGQMKKFREDFEVLI